ncbi:uncharacterized protein ARMOST_14041 [Armillaria ostoyae]|uniref:Uncharacterized protein n=1 Tax=Armillaria ostoyae TaxID=47428 RepID=A0A284RPG4_ARMOS|nr:uncharacterized protein ARMOST_14041 [Armillaria ostoyae]
MNSGLDDIDVHGNWPTLSVEMSSQPAAGAKVALVICGPQLSNWSHLHMNLVSPTAVPINTLVIVGRIILRWGLSRHDLSKGTNSTRRNQSLTRLEEILIHVECILLK